LVNIDTPGRLARTVADLVDRYPRCVKPMADGFQGVAGAESEAKKG